MIHSFNFENFFSFKDQSGVDFTVNDKAPDNELYFKQDKTRLNKVMGVIGANGSGKTNLLEALPFLRWFIIKSFSLEPDAPIPTKRFQLCPDSRKSPIKLGVVFDTKEKIYDYQLTFDDKGVISERLKHKTKSGYRLLFSRELDDKLNDYNIEAKNFNFGEELIQIIKGRPNASFFSTATRLAHEESKKIIDYWEKIYNINIPMLEERYKENILSTSEFYNTNKNIKSKVENTLKKLDLGLSGVKIGSLKTDEGRDILVPFGIHDMRNGEKKEFPFFLESTGTQNLFVLLKDLFLAFDTGGIVVFDEMESGLHPEMVLYIINLFLDKKTNHKNAQLLFSTHSLIALNKLDKYQIQLTEKNKFGESKTWRLDSKKGVRLDDNYLMKYLTGKYGAKPNIQS